MTQVKSSTLANIEVILLSIEEHAKRNQDLGGTVAVIGIAAGTIEGDGIKSVLSSLDSVLTRLKGTLEADAAGLRTVYNQLARLRDLATHKGYADVLELLNQELSYLNQD